MTATQSFIVKNSLSLETDSPDPKEASDYLVAPNRGGEKYCLG